MVPPNNHIRHWEEPTWQLAWWIFQRRQVGAKEERKYIKRWGNHFNNSQTAQSPEKVHGEQALQVNVDAVKLLLKEQLRAFQTPSLPSCPLITVPRAAQPHDWHTRTFHYRCVLWIVSDLGENITQFSIFKFCNVTRLKALSWIVWMKLTELKNNKLCYIFHLRHGKGVSHFPDCSDLWDSYYTCFTGREDGSVRVLLFSIY